MTSDFPDNTDERLKSKSQLKRDMHALQALGQELLQLPSQKLSELNLDERLIEALETLRAITAHGAQKRQMKFVGKLLRDADEGALRQALDSHRAPETVDTERLHDAEIWRERLLNDDRALLEWLEAHPQSDTRAFRSVLRAARSEMAPSGADAHGAGAQRKGKSYRQLFRQIRAALDAEADTDQA